MGIKRGQGQRTYKDRLFIERERNRIQAGDIVAINGYWRTVEEVDIKPDEGTTGIYFRYSNNDLGWTTGRSHNPIKKVVG